MDRQEIRYWCNRVIDARDSRDEDYAFMMLRRELAKSQPVPKDPGWLNGNRSMPGSVIQYRDPGDETDG